MPVKQSKKPTWTLWKTPDGAVWDYENSSIYNKATGQWTTAKGLGAIKLPASECEFVGALKLVSFHHGRSCHFYFQDLQTGHGYLMQGTEMEEILFNHTLYQGLICGRWGFVKKGGTISIKLLQELDDVGPTTSNSSNDQLEKLI